MSVSNSIFLILASKHGNVVICFGFVYAFKLSLEQHSAMEEGGNVILAIQLKPQLKQHIYMCKNRHLENVKYVFGQCAAYFYLPQVCAMSSNTSYFTLGPVLQSIRASLHLQMRFIAQLCKTQRSM